MSRRTVQDQFAHRLAGRGRVEHAPDTVSGRNEDTVNARHGADEGKAVFGDRPEARLPRFDRRRGKRRRYVPTQRFEPRVRALISAACRKGVLPPGVPAGRTDPPPSAQAKHAPSRCEPRSRATARRAAH